MNQPMYKIVGHCPFGTGTVDENGMMDNKEFRSANPADYIESDTGARLALHVAQQYGAKPVCRIVTKSCSLDVYALRSHYGIVCHYHFNLSSDCDIVWRNTVNPAALVRYAIENAPTDVMNLLK